MKAKIAIASTLKPVIDPRAYEKIGRSLVIHGGYEVHILGSLPTTKEIHPHLFLHPLANSKSIINRIMAPWKIFNLLQKIRPETLIITTHELLFIGTLYKIIFGKKLIYDIQENYFYNLLYQNNYPWGLRHLLAFYVRAKEILLTIFTDYFILAEKCYADEIGFINTRYSVIENKFVATEIEVKNQPQLQIEFLISGTISTEYGVFNAIHFFRQLPATEYKLIIVGHCPNKQTFRALQKEVSGIKNIDFIVSLVPVPHQDILRHIGNKTIGLLPYQVNKSTINKIPTKLYEYIGLRIPVLISPNPTWEKIIKFYQAGLVTDFNSTISSEEIRQCLTLSKDNQSIDLKDVMWINEENKLFTILDNWFS